MAERAGRSAGSLASIAGKEEGQMVGAAQSRGFGLPPCWEGAWPMLFNGRWAILIKSWGRGFAKQSKRPALRSVGNRPPAATSISGHRSLFRS